MYEIFLLLLFSMKLGVINSFLVVCFYNGLKVIKSENIYKIHARYYVMAINQHLWNIVLNLLSIQEEFYQLILSRCSIN